jgi:3',5'-cyclic AMP phosphodiesterase CpdA
VFGPLVSAIATLVAAGTVAAPPPTRTLIAVGDIASCAGTADEATAGVVARIPGTIAALGDLAYDRGTAEEYAHCYDPAWGRFKSRTRPSPGNHEYGTAGATPYYDYFGARAGPRGAGYYSYNLGAWHIAVLNSNCGPAGGCAAGSPQERWLRDDLRRDRALCTLAYWHHARFSSGLHGNDPTVTPLWRALYDAHADVVLSGHDHIYERFQPQNPAGRLEPTRGIREFVVGTGGRSLYPIVALRPNSVVHQNDTYGVLRLTLARGRYTFRFVRAAGGTFTDSGTARCR